MVYGWGSEWFPRYYAFYEKSGWGMPPRDPEIHVTKCGLSLGTTIYIVYGWGSERFPRYNTFYEMKGVGHAPGDPFRIHGPCHFMRLIIRNKNIHDLWVGIWTVSEILSILWKGVGHAPRGHPGVPRSMSLNEPYLKEQDYMVYEWGSKRFPRYNTFYEMKGAGHAPGGPPGDPWSMSLNAPRHKEQEYIWFMGEDLNGFQDIKHFVKWRGGTWSQGSQDPCH